MNTLFNDTDLFSSGALRIHSYEIPDAELRLFEHFFPREEADAFYNTLLEETHWKQETIVIHNKTLLTPRLTAWYGQRRSGREPLPLTAALLSIKKKVEEAVKTEFSSVLLNFYRDGQDSVAWHRDIDREFGPKPVIASVSFGETRPFQIRHKFRTDLERIEVPLNHGSLLLMGGPMQHFWEHRIPKTTKPIKPRINLTFRVVA